MGGSIVGEEDEVVDMPAPEERSLERDPQVQIWLPEVAQWQEWERRGDAALQLTGSPR